MSGFAFALVFVAAFLHAAWNLLAKRVESGVAFVFLANALAALIYTPIALAVLVCQHQPITGIVVGFILGSAVIHIAYFLVLQRGYLVGDLSLVYPLARGTGPMLSTMMAIALLGERPTPTAIAGILLILVGVFLLTGSPRQLWKSDARTAIGYGLLTGFFIACYTIWDKFAVSQFAISPMLLNYGCNLFETILLIPAALKYQPQIRIIWNNYSTDILGVALLSPLAYILVLVAMVFTPVSHVAPIRELSILIAVVIGNRLLAEGQITRRLLAAGVMVTGILLLAFN